MYVMIINIEKETLWREIKREGGTANPSEWCGKREYR